MSCEKTFEQIKKKFIDENYIGSCQNNPNESKCILGKFMIHNAMRSHNHDNWLKEYDYNRCLLDANKCQREACRSIFAHLTEMSYCLNLQKGCQDAYQKELDSIQNCYDNIDQVKQLLYESKTNESM